MFNTKRLVSQLVEALQPIVASTVRKVLQEKSAPRTNPDAFELLPAKVEHLAHVNVPLFGKHRVNKNGVDFEDETADKFWFTLSRHADLGVPLFGSALADIAVRPSVGRVRPDCLLTFDNSQQALVECKIGGWGQVHWDQFYKYQELARELGTDRMILIAERPQKVLVAPECPLLLPCDEVLWQDIHRVCLKHAVSFPEDWLVRQFTDYLEADHNHVLSSESPLNAQG